MPAYSRILLPWDSQPQEPIGAPLPPNSYVWNGASPTVDAASNLPITHTATPASVVATSGRGMALNGSTNIKIAGATSPGSRFVAFAQFLKTDTSVNGIIVAGKNGFSAASGFMFEFKTNANTLEINGGDGSTFPTLSVPNVGSVDGIVKTVAVEYAGTTAHVWMNGAYYGAVTIVAAGTWATGLALGHYTNVGAVNSCGATFFVGGVVVGGSARDISTNPWQLFAPRSIWVPVSVGGGSASTITAAAGASTASTLTASSTAASTPTAAAGAATASTVAASSTAASAITSATGTATASMLTGSAVVAGAITVAAGAGTGETLVGTTLAAGSAAIVAAGGVATAATLGGSSVAAADIGVAAGVATAATIFGSDITPVVPDVTSVGRRRKTRAQRLQDFDVPPPVEVLTSTIPSDKVVEPIAAPKVEPVPAKASKLAKPRPKKPGAPAPEVKAKAPTPKKPAAQVQAPKPVKAVAAPRPMMLSDILSAETMTPEEMIAAVKLLARIQLGPQLIRSTPRAKLIRA